MAPIALTSEYTSPPGLPAKKSEIADANQHNGVSYDGTATPYSATSTAVSEYGDKASAETAKSVVDSALPTAKSTPGDADYFTALLRSSAPTPACKAGSTVYGSAIAVLEAFATQQAGSVWVYDDAAQVGFGAGALKYQEDEKVGDKVHAVQARPGAGLELAGYSVQAQQKGALAVFASTSTLDLLLPSLSSIKGDVVIHLGTTATSDDLELVDTLLAPGIVKALTRVPEDWQVVFSSGASAVEDAAKIYGNGGKVIHVVESTHVGREVSNYTFPSASTSELDFNFTGSADDKEITVVPAGANAATSGAVLSLKTLSPSVDRLSAVLTGTGKTVSVVGGTKADADALKAVVLSALYSASGSSSQVLPTVKSVVATPAQAAAVEGSKTVAFYTAPSSDLAALVAQLFLSSPTLKTRLASYGSSAARGTKSVVSLTPAASTPAPLSANATVDVAWVNDANVLKSTDVIASLVPGGILVLELPWTEDEVPVKLTRPELIAIKEKKIRVFQLDLNPSTPSLPIRETAAFLLLYTGAQILPQGVRKVLDAFYGGDVSREDIEEPQAGLSELPAQEWEVPELEEGKTDKVKAAWEWDALPGQDGLIDVSTEAKPSLAKWDAVARHLLFREAFAVPADETKAKMLDPVADVPAIAALRPSTPDETFIVTVSENRRLTPPSYDRNVFHLELDTAGTGLKYEIGEAIGIHGWNDTAEILEFCSWYGLDPDAVVSFPNPEQAGTVESRTVFQLLQQNIDLFGRPGKAFYAELSKIATSRAEQMTLKFISAPEGAELFKKLAEGETVTYADILYRYRTARPSIEELVGLIPEIKPRHYSIASSQKAVGDKVELLIVTVDWINSKGSPRFGQCTRYLAALAPGSKVTVSIKPSVMKLPPDDKQPIIMAGLGTGAAPFRAFMQHRAWQRSQGIDVGPLLYYFGSRYRSQEYLYGEEIEAYIASGIISHAGLAFSRDGKDKMYIQHKMSQDKELLSKLLLGKGSEAAYFYLCGPTWPVPDVYEALVGALTENGGMERKGAEEFIEDLKEEERYVLEVY